MKHLQDNFTRGVAVLHGGDGFAGSLQGVESGDVGVDEAVLDYSGDLGHGLGGATRSLGW